jgi:hypothetical protein
MANLLSGEQPAFPSIHRECDDKKSEQQQNAHDLVYVRGRLKVGKHLPQAVLGCDQLRTKMAA